MISMTIDDKERSPLAMSIVNTADQMSIQSVEQLNRRFFNAGAHEDVAIGKATCSTSLHDLVGI